MAKLVQMIIGKMFTQTSQAPHKIDTNSFKHKNFQADTFKEIKSTYISVFKIFESIVVHTHARRHARTHAHTHPQPLESCL